MKRAHLTRQKSHTFSGGFTIVELLIATTIFAVVLLLCTSALLQIGRTYQKGTIVTRNQDVARTVMGHLNESIQFGGKNIYLGLSGGGGTRGACVGRYLYSYLQGTMLPVNDAGRHALVVQDLNRPCGSSDVPSDLTIPGPLPAGSQEFLQPLMRVADFVVTEVTPGSNLYRVSIKIAYGEDDLFCAPNSVAGSCNPASPALTAFNYPDLACKAVSGSQFCAVSGLTGTTNRRVK